MLHLDLSRFRGDAVEPTPSGGLRIPIRPTRVGVLEYRRADGSIRREYRPPEEVFAPESLASLAGAPVTIDHPAAMRVTAESWRELAVGHMSETARADGTFVDTACFVQDKGTVEAVRRGELLEASAGYSCDFDPTPGVTPDGERYDGRQTNIRYNHVALLAPGRGRAGGDVRLRVDSACAIVESEPDQSAGSERNSRMTLDEALKQIGALEGQLAAEKTRADSAEGQLAVIKSDLEKARNDAAPANVEKLVRERAELVANAALVLGSEFRADGKDEATILREVAGELAPAGASLDFLRGVAGGKFASAKAGAASASQVRTDAAQAPGQSVGQSAAEAARLAMIERNRNKFSQGGK